MSRDVPEGGCLLTTVVGAILLTVCLALLLIVTRVVP